MLRDLLSSRAIQIGLIFFVLIVVGTQLYSWHVHRTIDVEMARTNRIVQQLETHKGKRPAPDAIVPTDTKIFSELDTPAETDEPQRSEETEALPPLDALADAFLPDDFVSEEESAEDVPVSPFGFGPYPEVPADYFGEPIWMRDPDIFSEFPNEARKNIELIDRVLVKLWQQGDREIVGGSTYNGKVYPHYDNVVYVRWKAYELPDGSVHRYISREIGAGEGPTSDDIVTGNIPPNFKVVDLDDAGFDPYQFLNLEHLEEY